MRIFFLIFFIILFQLSNLFDVEAKSKRKKAKKYPKPKFELIEETNLYSGLDYQKYLYTVRGAKIQSNVLKIDLNNDSIEIDILKAGNNITVNSKIRELVNYHDSIDNHETIAAINGNFWKAYTNYPIGSLFRDGKVIEIKPYKEWSSFFLDKDKKPFINNFKLTCQVFFPNGNKIYISDINKRRDSNSIIMYNSYGGDIIPYIRNKDIDQMYNQLLYEQAILETFDDSTEIDVDYDALKESIIEKNRSELFESKLMKIKMKLIEPQCINRPFKTVVTMLDTGTIELAEDEIILSFGLLYPDFNYPKIGDTIRFEITSNFERHHNFRDGITGTPRLVRNGNASHEAKNEGSRSRRFINSRLPRTAVGYDKDKCHVYLVTISGQNKLSNSKGASLAELAIIMKNIGCWDAMNLDGGGSTMMIINGENVENPNYTDIMRKINTVIAVRKLM